MRGLLLVGAAALALAAPALGQDSMLADLEDEVICPTCKTTLEMSASPVADRMRAFIRRRASEGATKQEIKDELVEQFGEGVLAAPPKRGFNLLAWALPLAGLALAVAAVTLLARRWRRTRGPDEPAAAAPGSNGRAPLDPALERRLDEELARYDT